MASRPRLNVQSFPRPPLLERTPRRIQIKWQGEVIADTQEAYWVLETHHAPTYYLPPSAVRLPLSTTQRTSACEWKGVATYYSIMSPISASETVYDRIWSYNEPTKAFEPIRGYLAFYAAPWDCYVDGEQALPQLGDFYGGWVTSDIGGVVKGQWGNMDPMFM